MALRSVERFKQGVQVQQTDRPRTAEIVAIGEIARAGEFLQKDISRP